MTEDPWALASLSSILYGAARLFSSHSCYDVLAFVLPFFARRFDSASFDFEVSDCSWLPACSLLTPPV